MYAWLNSLPEGKVERVFAIHHRPCSSRFPSVTSLPVTLNARTDGRQARRREGPVRSCRQEFRKVRLPLRSLSSARPIRTPRFACAIATTCWKAPLNCSFLELEGQRTVPIVLRDVHVDRRRSALGPRPGPAPAQIRSIAQAVYMFGHRRAKRAAPRRLALVRAPRFQSPPAISRWRGVLRLPASLPSCGGFAGAMSDHTPPREPIPQARTQERGGGAGRRTSPPAVGRGAAAAGRTGREGPAVPAPAASSPRLEVRLELLQERDARLRPLHLRRPA